ncbi:MAG: hypothetical protein ACLSX5_06165, partial [Lachnospiraceae bacterium]
MKKSKVIGLLFASAFLVAGSQLGIIQAEARPHDKEEKWEDRWNNGRWGDWDDDRWDHDDDDDDDDDDD